MGKSKCGRLTNEHAWRRTQRPIRRCGASSGYQRLEKVKDLQRLEQIEVSLSTGRQPVVENQVKRIRHEWSILRMHKSIAGVARCQTIVADAYF